jgi:hypothetical protein
MPSPVAEAYHLAPSLLELAVEGVGACVALAAAAADCRIRICSFTSLNCLLNVELVSCATSANVTDWCQVLCLSHFPLELLVEGEDGAFRVGV